jgi:hypothetical protein
MISPPVDPSIDPQTEQLSPSPETEPKQPEPPAGDADPDVETLKQLPKEVGVMLMSVGVMGLVLPGIVGTPAFIVGGLVLWPKTFSRMETWFRGRCPELHQKGVVQMKRYIADLDRRYPEQPKPESSTSD